MWRRWLRLVLTASLGAVRNDTQRGIFVLGSDSGLRGLRDRRLRRHQRRGRPPGVALGALAAFSQRFGALLFYDMGDVGPSLSALVPKHDVGIGLRWLIPQVNSTAIRIDWALATQNTALTRAGFLAAPARACCGFRTIVNAGIGAS
jgi:hypothetical protein